MNFACWTSNAWAVGSWVEGSWCPGVTPPPPTPTPVRIEARRFPGPPIVIYNDGPIPAWMRKRENEEIIIL